MTTSTHPVTLSRVVTVEARKMVDTRSARWLLIAAVAMSVLGSAYLALRASRPATAGAVTTTTVLQMGITAVGVLLPIAAILLVTSEWSTRSALTTFTQEPRRARVLCAKAIVALAAAIVGELIGFAIGGLVLTLSRLVWKGPHGPMAWSHLAGSMASVLVSVLMGFALACLLSSTAASIVVYFLVPMGLNLVAQTGGPVAGAVSWIDVQGVMSSLGRGAPDAGRLATSLLVWIVLPCIAGWYQLRRRDIA